jgi:hypothetical protein
VIGFKKLTRKVIIFHLQALHQIYSFDKNTEVGGSATINNSN